MYFFLHKKGESRNFNLSCFPCKHLTLKFKTSNVNFLIKDRFGHFTNFSLAPALSADRQVGHGRFFHITPADVFL